MNRGRAGSIAWLALIALALPPPAEAARFWRWKDGQGTTIYGDRPPADPAADARSGTFRRPPGDPVVLHVRDRGSHYEITAFNSAPGPVQVQLDLARADNVRPVPSLPASQVVPAGGSVVVARIYPVDPRLPNAFEANMLQLPGDPRARPLDFEYRVPFDYGRVRVDQGFGGRFSHSDAQNFYAIDFALPEGTPVLAARGGTVMQVESDFQRAGLDREHYGGRANFIRILHEDGSMALYAHLKPEGVEVRVGQQVRQGQRIALSGNTGYSTAPHLHFAVQANGGMRLEAIPFRMFGALGELKFAREDPAPPR